MHFSHFYNLGTSFTPHNYRWSIVAFLCGACVFFHPSNHHTLSPLIHNVTCNMLLPARGLLLSPPPVVWPHCCASSFLLWERGCALFPCHSWIGPPPKAKHWSFMKKKKRRSMLPSGYIAQTLPNPLWPYYAMRSWVASGALWRPLV